ncbi:MAG: DUF892 family protein [Deltaproteobacteria bacterium]|nr:DUF892 family protein [Deltaproteobacteria bacterium]
MSHTVTLEELLSSTLRELYHTHKQLLQKLPILVDSVKLNHLKILLSSHLFETGTHISRLEAAASVLSSDIEFEKRSAAVADLMRSLDKALGERWQKDSGVLDVNVIVSLKCLKRYSMALYCNALEFANELGMDEVFERLATSFYEENALTEDLGAVFEDEQENDRDANEIKSPAAFDGSAAWNSGRIMAGR